MNTGAAQIANVVRFLAWPLVLVIVALVLGALLVLRVFRIHARSEAFYNRLFWYWRFG